MEILSEVEHRILTYIATLNRGGHQPSAADVVEFEAGRRGPKVEFPWASTGSWTAVAATLGSLVKQTEPAETTVDYLIRIGALASVDGLVATSLGQALLLGLGDAPTDAVVNVVTVDDPHALELVVGHIGGAGPGAMLVDPYLRLAEALLLLDSTSVERVLVRGGSSKRQKDLDSIKSALSVSPAPRRFEVRVGGEELHDRCLIPISGAVTMIGGSISTLRKRTVVLTTVHDEDGAVRSNFERNWNAAEVLVVCEPHDSNSDA